jgi:hypothetical protein
MAENNGIRAMVDIAQHGASQSDLEEEPGTAGRAITALEHTVDPKLLLQKRRRPASPLTSIQK